MKYLFSIFLFLSVFHVNAQIQFIGLDHTVCPQPMSNIYSFSNFSIGSGGSGTIYGFDILKNGVVVHSESGQMSNGKHCLDLVFINDSVGFLVYYSGLSSNRVLRTGDYGVTWNDIGGGAPNYFGLYVVNASLAYLVTQWNTPMQLYVARCSNIPGNMNPLFITDYSITSDVFVTDTLLSADLCNSDSLRIYVLNGTDAVTYHINFHLMSTGTGTAYEIAQQGISVVPNPAAHAFSLYMPANEVASVCLFSLEGNLIKCYDAPDDSFQRYSLEGISDGMCILKVVTGKAEVFTSKMLIIK